MLNEGAMRYGMRVYVQANGAWGRNVRPNLSTVHGVGPPNARTRSNANRVDVVTNTVCRNRPQPAARTAYAEVKINAVVDNEE